MHVLTCLIRPIGLTYKHEKSELSVQLLGWAAIMAALRLKQMTSLLHTYIIQ
jgi:hypothetical protein